MNPAPTELVAYRRADGFYQCRNAANEVTAATVRTVDLVVPEHQHPEAQLSVVFRGAGVRFVSSDRVSRLRTTPVMPGSVVYIAPGELHRTLWQGSAEMLNLYWTEEYLRELADQSGCRMPNAIPSYRLEPGIQAIAQVLMEDFVWTGELSPLLVDQGRSLMAVRLLRLFEKQSLRPPTGLLSEKRLQVAVDVLRATPENDFTLVELARLCHSSVFHFSHSFTVRFGCAPFAFQRNLRMQKARELLTSTELSVEAVGYAVGFASPNSFSRVFRRATGQSPREYRRFPSGHSG